MISKIFVCVRIFYLLSIFFKKKPSSNPQKGEQKGELFVYKLAARVVQRDVLSAIVCHWQTAAEY